MSAPTSRPNTASARLLPATLDSYTSADEPMQRCLRLAALAARTDLPILVLGESGTGKTVIAHAIHQSSARREGPFISFNAAALSDTLLDSQLFGHEKGAFTGAEKQVKGKFELAHEGTLFFDEIADLSLAGQAKILRAVESGEFERLGGEGLRHANVRLITATCHPLRDFVASRQFRQDLIYRIKGITLHIPALRERPRDLPRLIRSEIVRSAKAMRKTISGIEEDAFKLLISHSWPGNLRELSQVIHVAVAVTEGDVIERDTIIIDEELPEPSAIALDSLEQPTATPTPENDAAPDDANANGNGVATLADAEKRHIAHVLAHYNGNKRQTAKALGVSRSTLDRKLERYQLG